VTAPTATRIRRIDLARARSDGGDAAVELASLMLRSAAPDPDLRDAVRRIVGDVRERRDAAVVSWNDKVGGGRIWDTYAERLLVSRRELDAARDALAPDVRRALEDAIANVRRFAESQLPKTTRTETVPGVEIERRWVPLDRVGCYVPGGSAAYPSSLIMCVVPAQVAGVRVKVVASPAGPGGALDPVLLATASLLDVDAFVVAGGAQAIAALAFGVSGLPPVEKIVGPGNRWVTAAKFELAGSVAIDMLAGPSEGMVLADGTADPVTVAADLVTQAEHGPDSPAILVTDDEALADAVDAHLPGLLASNPRRAILAEALLTHGRFVIVPSIDAGVEIVNDYGPEHLSIDVADPESVVSRIRNAGSVFVGPWAPESAGDYATGANHVLPTGGLARASGALSVETFGKHIQVQRITRDGLARLRPTIATLAEAEGLHAHRHAVDVRFERSAEPTR